MSTMGEVNKYVSDYNETQKFISDLKTHQKNPADIKKYERWVKELKGPVRKTLLEVIKGNTVSNQDLSTLSDELKRIKPIVASKQSFKMLSTREKGLWKSICRAFSNIFQNRTSSKELINAIQTHNVNHFDADHILPSDQKDALGKNLFALIADLPCREVTGYKDLSDYSSLASKYPVTVIYDNFATGVYGVYLALNLKATHTPSPNAPQLEPISFAMLIQFSDMNFWTTDKDLDTNLLYGFKPSSNRPEQDLNKKLKEVFWRNDHHDNPEMIEKDCHYDLRWLVARLSNGDTAFIRHVPRDAGIYDVSDPTYENYGYWELTPNTPIKQ